MKVRELRVFDIRCACGAGPGAICDLAKDRVNTDRGTHLSRIREHAELVEAGWKWQEVDPRDAGRKE